MLPIIVEVIKTANTSITEIGNHIVITVPNSIITTLLDSEFQSRVFLERNSLINEFLEDLDIIDNIDWDKHWRTLGDIREKYKGML